MVRISAYGLSALALLPLALALLATAGCGGGNSKVPVGEPAENIRKLALAYVQFAAQNRGRGPADQAVLQEFMVERNKVDEQEAQSRFVSPRDDEPYVIRWGLNPQGSGPMGPNPPEPPIIIYEATGAEGTRYVADGKMKITEMTEEEFAAVAPAE